jgi:predicted Rossmann fold nucleotide-binding protein DprA/Smf involved in DNA uptake
VISCLTKEPKHVDRISAESGTSSHETLGILAVLEINGMAKQLPGKYFVIC